MTPINDPLPVFPKSKRPRLWVLAFVCSLLVACSWLKAPPDNGNNADLAENPQQLFSLTSPEGERLLYGSSAKQDFLPLSVHFVSQQNLAFCGVASMTMVLNALGVSAPIDPIYKRYPMFTQDNVLNTQTEQVVGARTLLKQGMTLDQLGGLLATYPVQAKVYHASDSSLSEFRKLAVENLRQAGNFVLVNYLRVSMGQESGGHISPLGAYDEASDRFLVMDVARFKYPPVWVSAELLWQAMHTIDDASGTSRGFVLVSR